MSWYDNRYIILLKTNEVLDLDDNTLGDMLLEEHEFIKLYLVPKTRINLEIYKDKYYDSKYNDKILVELWSLVTLNCITERY